MKLQTLSLKAFGPFTDRELQLNPQATLHLIYGPNESGKSSSLRALRNLLYGFPHQTPDDFLHPTSKLQIGGTFQTPEGGLQEFVRWKRRKRDLTDPSGEEDLSGLMDRYLSGLKPEMFDRLYGLTHSDLVSGGQALLELGGRVGESLFTASLGPEYHNLAAELKAEHEELWSSRPSKKTLNSLIKEWEETQAEVNRLALSSEEWTRAQADWEKVKARSESLKADLQAVLARIEKKERFHKATQDIVRRGELLKSLSEYEGVPELTADFSARSSQVRAELKAAKHGLELNQKRLEEGQKQLEEFPDELPILEFSERIEALYKRVSQMTENALQQPAAETELAACRNRIVTIQEKLGGEESRELDIPGSAWRSSARREVQEYNRLKAGLESQERQLKELASLLAEQSETEMSEPLQHLPTLEIALQSTRRNQSLDDTLARLEAELRIARSTLELELSNLPCWSGDMDALDKARVPSPGTVDEHERTLSETQSWVKDMEDGHRLAARKLEELSQKLAELEAEGELVSRQALKMARAHRDELWSELYHCWVSGESPQSEAQLVGEFQNSLREADTLADKLMQQGERAALYEQLSEQKQRAAQEVEHSEKVLSRAWAALLEKEAAWKALWLDSGVLVESPRHMSGWLKQREELVKSYRRLLHRETEREQIRQKIVAELQALSKATTVLALPPFPVERGIGGAVEMVEAVLKTLRDKMTALETARQRRADREAQVQSLQARRDELERSLKAWKKDWQTLLAELPFELKPSPEELEETLTLLEELHTELEREKQLSAELARMEKELLTFREETTQLLGCLPDMSEHDDPVRVVERAQSAHREAVRMEETQARLQSEIRKLEESLPSLETEWKKIETSLSLLLNEAGVQTVEELDAAILRAGKKRELAQELRLTEDAIRKLSGSSTLEDFCAAHARLDQDSLTAEIQSLKEEAADLTEQRDESLQLAGQLKEKADSLDGTSTSARLSQEAQLAEAEAREVLDRYVRLVMAERLLRDAIEQFRKENEGPILEKASHYFNRLTNGAYPRLQTGYDGKSAEPVLFAVSKSDREVSVEGLSDGTCDQLFLALRLATIARSAGQNQLLPVIADDILVQFDDQRARSALQALADFSSVTQVVLFTHLERDFELAQSLNDSRVDLIRLPELAL